MQQQDPLGTGSAAGAGGAATGEADRLIASDKVEGTAVYNRQGERLGSVHTLMVDKRSGQVAYAVMSFGGFLGMGEHYHPLPWKTLTYDTGLGGYVVDLDKDKLKAGPSYATGAGPTWDRNYSEWIDRHYGVSPYWGDTSGG
jgi:PRC-barrel domain